MTEPEPRFRDYRPTPEQEAAHQQIIEERAERVERIRQRWMGIDKKKKPKK
ncbi:MAG: hypothetical protein V4714_17695 [Bacteroidota bacterium]